MLTQSLLLVIALSYLCTSSAYILSPSGGWTASCQRRWPMTPTLRSKSKSLVSMRGADKPEREGEAADTSERDALVTPPGSFGSYSQSSNLLPPGPSNLDFVSELVMGKLSKESDNMAEDGNVRSEPISVPVGGEKVELGSVVRPMMSMIFTCNVCETRQMRSFTKLAYEKGIVIVTCKGCGAKHLIADNLGWYRDWMEKGDQNVQDMMRRKGIEVPRIDGEEALSLYEEWKE